MAEAVVQLDLRPPSQSRVFWAILLTSLRYGQNDANLTLDKLVVMTGLKNRTVQAALSGLIDRGLIARVGRYGRLRVNLLSIESNAGSADKLAPPEHNSRRRRRADKLAPPTRRQACASPTVYMFSCISNKVSDGVFTAKQLDFIDDVMVEATQLLGSDVNQLTLTEDAATDLGLAVPITYGEALQQIAGSQNKKLARDFTKVVRDLRGDERVQGADLDTSHLEGHDLE